MATDPPSADRPSRRDEHRLGCFDRLGDALACGFGFLLASFLATMGFGALAPHATGGVFGAVAILSVSAAGSLSYGLTLAGGILVFSRRATLRTGWLTVGAGVILAGLGALLVGRTDRFDGPSTSVSPG